MNQGRTGEDVADDGRVLGDSAIRVLHVNDVAGVASAAVASAQSGGLPWRLWTLPAVRGSAVPIKLWRRARDLVRFRPAGQACDVLHVHYGLFGYYAWSVRRPYVLHLHGTDVRGNLRSRALGPLVRAAIRRAGAVVFSTPDLADEVRALRPDATWLPAPLSPAVDATPARIGLRKPAGRPGAAPRIVFASRWDPVKGLQRQLALARDLRGAHPDAELIGVDWGTGAPAAAEAGVALRPMLPAAEFRALMASADIVVGQLASGALGIADLEAMALGRPLIARFAYADAYGSDPAIWNTATCDPMTAVASILADPDATVDRCAATRSWALEHHGAEAFVRAALPIYGQLLGRAPSRE
jgi:glycosyltransferase involved in cell wall biosynthesis